MSWRRVGAAVRSFRGEPGGADEPETPRDRGMNRSSELILSERSTMRVFHEEQTSRGSTCVVS